MDALMFFLKLMAGVSVIYAVIPPPLSRSPERRASV